MNAQPALIVLNASADYCTEALLRASHEVIKSLSPRSRLILIPREDQLQTIPGVPLFPRNYWELPGSIHNLRKGGWPVSGGEQRIWRWYLAAQAARVDPGLDLLVADAGYPQVLAAMLKSNLATSSVSDFSAGRVVYFEQRQLVEIFCTYLEILLSTEALSKIAEDLALPEAEAYRLRELVLPFHDMHLLNGFFQGRWYPLVNLACPEEESCSPRRSVKTSDHPIVLVQRGECEYLQTLLAVARRWNPETEIMVISDVDYSGAAARVRHIPISEYSKAEEALNSCYQHFSYYDFEFERFCMARWFILRDFMQREGLQICFHADSDLAIVCELRDVAPRFTQFDLTLAGTHCGHSSFINSREALAAFCDLVSNSFRSEKQNYLSRQRANHLEKNLGWRPTVEPVNDMFFWEQLRASDRVSIGEMCVIENNSSFDYALGSRELGYQMSGEFKAIHWREDIPYCLHEPSGLDIRLNTLHFRGSAKSQISPYFRSDSKTL